ncbi:MAG: DNA repair protein RadA, partial [Bacteroidales bacterium]|nr:DNA repair protein RadA [Bacteroidales bacterium]
GLSGEIRPVPQASRRALEAARLGFRRIFVSAYTHIDKQVSGIEIVRVPDIPALVRSLFK